MGTTSDSLATQLDEATAKVRHLATEANIIRLSCRRVLESQRAKAMRGELEELAERLAKMAHQARWQK